MDSTVHIVCNPDSPVHFEGARRWRPVSRWYGPTMNESPPRIQVIVGTIRDGRFSEKPAAWLIERLSARSDLEAELVDLRDHPLPFYDQSKPPARGLREYPPDVTRWAAKLEEADGYVIVTAEYNHGYPAVLKNALDHVFPELNRKPVAFVGYGNVGGARAIEQLRLVAVEFEMAPLRQAIHILPALMVPAKRAEGPFDTELFGSLDEKLDVMAKDLAWWAGALSRARAV
jgi:NAD(P)H-dependent FMN reductase